MNKETPQLKDFSQAAEQLFVKDFLIWLDAQDRANRTLRMSIEQLTSQNVNAPPSEGSVELPFNAENITWNTKTGEKGPFELTKDYSNSDYQALLGFLKTHAGGAVASQGQYYWVLTDGKSIGRKPSNQVKRRP